MLIAISLLYYFRFLAQIQLKKIGPEIIGVTGSSGKTSAMGAIQSVLQDDRRVKVSEKANSQSGLPLNILGLEVKKYSVVEWIKLALLAPLQLLINWQKYDVYVAEMGVDNAQWPANMEYLLTFLKPDIGVFTSVTSVHAQGFDHKAKSSNSAKHQQEVLTAIAHEKGRMIAALPPDGFAILNEDDELVTRQRERTSATVITFGTGASASVQLIGTNWTAQGTEFVLKDNYTQIKSSKKPANITLPGYLLPRHYGLTLAAAGAVGLTKNISLSTSTQRLQTHFYLPPGRASLLPGINDSTILDSSYNSSPLALHDFLEMLASIKKLLNSTKKTSDASFKFTRLIALLGDMRELGQSAKMEHIAVANQATAIFDYVFLVGPLMTEFATPIFQHKRIPTQSFVSPWQAITPLTNVLQPGDLLFVKGSQNTILLETTIAPLLKNPSDQQKLCRRSTYWSQQRQKLQ